MLRNEIFELENNKASGGPIVAMKNEIVLRVGKDVEIYSDVVIMVPEIAIEEAGFIRTFAAKTSAQTKHEFHAVAQMAYYQFQDEELVEDKIVEKVSVEHQNIKEGLVAGMVIYRSASGSIHILTHEGQNTKKLLEAAHRFCTRWVRLDI